MSNIAQAGVDHIIDTADVATDKAIGAIQATVDHGVDAGVAGIVTGKAMFDTGIAHIQALRKELLAAMKAVADQVTSAFPGGPPSGSAGA